MKIFYKLARKYLHLYAESQKDVKILQQQNAVLRNDYMKSLEREEKWLKKIFDMELKLAQYKFRGSNEE